MLLLFLVCFLIKLLNFIMACILFPQIKKNVIKFGEYKEFELRFLILNN